MAEILFDMEYHRDPTLNEKVLESRNKLKELLDQNEDLSNFEAKIILSNKNEFDLTKFILKEVNPASEFKNVLQFLHYNFRDFLGG